MNQGPIVKRKRGFSVVPFFGDLVVLSRVLRDTKAHWGMKLVAIATLLYVVIPFDALPEAVLPVIAWVDDIGLVLAVRIVLHRVLAKYRYPLFEEGPKPKEIEVVERASLTDVALAGRVTPVEK